MDILEKEKVMLLPHERVDDLQYKGLRVIQNPDAFCFGTDSVLLAHFVTLRQRADVVELCSGSGVISLLLAGRYGSARFELVEVQPAVADMSRRSIALNGLEARLTVSVCNLRDYSRPGKADVVLVNPPYQRLNDGADRSGAEATAQAIARKELLCTLEDVVRTASAVLNDKGKLFVVHRVDRLADLFCLMREYGIEPKRLCCVAVREGEAPKLILAEGVKGGASGLRWDTPLVLYDGEGNLTERVKKIYEGGEI